jgi:hypothetical protein
MDPTTLDTAQFFDDNELSDVLLHLVTNDLSGNKRLRALCDEHKPDDAIRSFKMHAVILAVASPMLHAQILRWSGAVDSDGRKRIRISVQSDEVQAAEDVFRFLYTRRHPTKEEDDENKMRHLFRMFVVADRLGMTTVRDDIIWAAKPGSVDDVNFVLGGEAQQAVPSSLWTQAQMAALREACTSYVVDDNVFGDVSKLLREGGDRLDSFRSMCFDTVHAFARSDKLHGRNDENDLVVLLSTWIRANECDNADRLASLTNTLRLERLSASFLVNLATLAPWATPDAPTVAHATFIRLNNADKKATATTNKATTNTFTMRCVFNRTNLDDLLARAQPDGEPRAWCWSRDQYYYNGYMWTLGAGLERDRNNGNGNNEYTLMFGFRVELPVSMLAQGARVDMPLISCVAESTVGTNRTANTTNTMGPLTHFFPTKRIPMADADTLMDDHGNVPMCIVVRLSDSAST